MTCERPFEREMAEIHTELAPALVSEHGGHHTTTNVRRRELGRDDGGKGVVTTDAHAHDKAPYNEDTDDVDRMTGTRESLTEGSDDDQHELDAVCMWTPRLACRCGGRLEIRYAHMRLRPTTSASQPKRS